MHLPISFRFNSLQAGGARDTAQRHSGKLERGANRERHILLTKQCHRQDDRRHHEWQAQAARTLNIPLLLLSIFSPVPAVAVRLPSCLSFSLSFLSLGLALLCFARDAEILCSFFPFSWFLFSPKFPSATSALATLLSFSCCFHVFFLSLSSLVPLSSLSFVLCRLSLPLSLCVS